MIFVQSKPFTLESIYCLLIRHNVLVLVFLLLVSSCNSWFYNPTVEIRPFSKTCNKVCDINKKNLYFIRKVASIIRKSQVRDTESTYGIINEGNNPSKVDLYLHTRVDATKHTLFSSSISPCLKIVDLESSDMKFEGKKLSNHRL